MTLNLPSKHRPLFSQSNFFEIDQYDEPQRKKQRLEDSQTIPDSLHFNGTDSDNTETKSNDDNYVRLFDEGSTPNSSRNARVQDDDNDEILNKYVRNPFVLIFHFGVIQIVYCTPVPITTELIHRFRTYQDHDQ